MVKCLMEECEHLEIQGTESDNGGPKQFQGLVVSGGKKSIKCHPKETFTKPRSKHFAKKENPF